MCPLCASATEGRILVRWQDLKWRHCDSCGGGWREPYIPETTTPDADTTETYGKYLENPGLFRYVAREKVAWIRGRAHLATAIILELGAGTGAVADELVRAGFDPDRYAAVEPNPEFAAALRARGYTVFDGDPAEALVRAAGRPRPAGSRTVVLLDNVLEHVPMPLRFLETLRRQIPVPATYLIEVPNECGLRWRAPFQDRLRGDRKAPTFPGHINLFTPRSFAHLVRTAFPGARIYQRGLRHPDEVRRLQQCASVSTGVRAVLALLRTVPLDRLLNVAYFLRAEAVVK